MGVDVSVCLKAVAGARLSITVTTAVNVNLNASVIACLRACVNFGMSVILSKSAVVSVCIKVAKCSDILWSLIVNGCACLVKI